MSFTAGSIHPCNPATERGVSTKLSISKDKLVYTNGRAVIIRDLNDPANAFAYTGHARNVSVAKISPSGYYCASADINGTVRIWDTVGEDHVVKGEFPVISGRINDIAWDGESKRLIVAGAGKEQFGRAIMFDTGTSSGEIEGHSKAINAASIRQQRPYRAVTGADDGLVVFHTGVPFKFSKTIKTHTRFVQDVQFSGSGDNFVSVGSDSKIFIYDGKTGDSLGEFSAEDGHKGSIMSASWSPDDKLIATSSLDKTVKLWDVETQKVIQTWTLGKTVSNQQVGNVWSPSGDIISLSLSGELNIFDQRDGDKPSRILYGPQRPISSGTLAPATAGAGTFLAGTGDGRIVAYSSTVEARIVEGPAHAGLVTGVAASAETAVSVGFDDQLRELAPDAANLTGGSAPLGKQAKAVALAPDGTAFVAEIGQIEVFRQCQKLAEVGADYGPLSVSVTAQFVAVGGEDNKVHVYTWDGQELTEDGVLEGHRSAVTAVAFSPDGSLLASGESAGRVHLYDVKERKAIESSWTYHSGRITSLAWTASGQNLASGALDTHVHVWSLQKRSSKIALLNANPGGVNSVVWLESDDTKGKLATAGADACLRTWNVTFVQP